METFTQSPTSMTTPSTSAAFTRSAPASKPNLPPPILTSKNSSKSGAKKRAAAAELEEVEDKDHVAKYLQARKASMMGAKDQEGESGSPSKKTTTFKDDNDDASNAVVGVVKEEKSWDNAKTEGKLSSTDTKKNEKEERKRKKLEELAKKRAKEEDKAGGDDEDEDREGEDVDPSDPSKGML